MAEETAPTQALPRNAKLVQIGTSYRVMWNLGDGLGWAWYQIDKAQLLDLFKTATHSRWPTAWWTMTARPI